MEMFKITLINYSIRAALRDLGLPSTKHVIVAVIFHSPQVPRCGENPISQCFRAVHQLIVDHLIQ